MRSFAVPPGLCLASVLACTTPNPAYHASQGGPEGSTSGEPGTTATTASPTTTTTSTTTTSTTTIPTDTTVGETQPLTTGTTENIGETTGDTATTDTTTTTDATSTGPDATSMVSTDSTGGDKLDMGAMDSCPAPVVPDLAVTIKHSPGPPSCNAAFGPILHGVFVAAPDPTTRQFRECSSFNDCKQHNAQCPAKQTVTIQFDGPTTHVPNFEPGQCVNIGYVGTGHAAPDTCDTSFLRIAEYQPELLLTDVYVSGVGVPHTAKLPVPWSNVLDFAIAPDLVLACGDDNSDVCDLTTGQYDLVGTFSNQNYTIPMGTDQPAKLPVVNLANIKVGDMAGSLYNLRSFAHPVDACEFKWIWLADKYKP